MRCLKADLIIVLRCCFISLESSLILEGLYGVSRSNYNDGRVACSGKIAWQYYGYKHYYLLLVEHPSDSSCFLLGDEYLSFWSLLVCVPPVKYQFPCHPLEHQMLCRYLESNQ